MEVIIMKTAKRILSALMAALIVLSCWVWIAPESSIASAANSNIKNRYLFAYFTGTSKEGQTIHLAVSEDGYNYTALRNNEPVIIPSKGVGNVRDPYIWYNEQDNYYYILATDLDFTDGGGTYSNNSQSFIIWRSKDLVNWYDETFIDVSKMAHLIGDTRNMSAVWAPQVLWDGSAYVVYFTLACNATSWFDIVYLKTTDLMNPDAYYEFDYILGNGTGNGTDNGYGVIDADIIHNPGDGKYYLFYKTECNSNELGTTNIGTSLKTVHYYVGDTPTGPFTNPGDNKWSNCGFSIFPNYNVSLEGCNSFFDNDGNLIMYVDEFEHTNAAGEAEAYFHIAKSNGYDFTSWSYPDVSQHNINSLSPRHGSVVKITEDEYNRLLNNSYNVSSSSFPETETLEDHLVARYFTTSNSKENTVVGQPDLDSAVDIEMDQDVTGEWYAIFNGTTSYAQTDFDALFLKSNGLNYEDGFTITFSAYNFPMATANSENNDRIYEIANVFGDQSSSTAYYTHFSPSGGGTGSYLGNYNGPVKAGSYDWLADKDGSNRDDNCIHEYIISYATGNVKVYVDGELVISRNRFTGSTTLDDSWYKALGSNATMRIGKSGWDADPLFEGYLQDLCIYDCSMSYYDAKSLDEDLTVDQGWVGERTYNGVTSVVPTFNSYSTSGADSYYSNILYSSALTGMPEGDGTGANPTSSTNPAVVWENVADCYFGVYYAETTVLILDGKNSAVMPVFFAGRQNTNGKDRYVYNVYPTDALGSNADNTEINLKNSAHSNLWKGWTNEPNPSGCLTTGNSQTMGSANGMSGYYAEMEDANSQSGRAVRYYLNSLKVDENNIDFNGKYYKKFNLSWQYYGGSSTTYTENDANLKGNKISDNDIYVINFKPILDYRAKITETEYNSVMNNSELCPELREKYAAAVYDIRTLDPVNFGFAEAPETATMACGKAIAEAIGTYDGVMAEIAREKAAGTYGHQCTELEAREATCAKNGLTEGSYCVLCGEIIKEQEVLAPLPHSFGDIFTENGVQYKQCSDCGVKIEYQPSEARYENLFSFNGWNNSASKGVFSGTISTDPTNGRITIVNQHTGEIYTRGTFDGQNLVATRDFGNYCIPVTGGETYVVEATSLASSTSGGEVFIFQYNKDGLAFSAIPTVLGLSSGQTAHSAFTVDKNAAYIELRFDCNDAGQTITYEQIGVYKKENFDRFGADTADARLGFYPGDSKDLCYPNAAAGYVFDGWYTSNGVRIENVNQLNNPTTIVYGKWISAGYNIVYDSLFSFSDWAKSSCNRLWYGDSKDANGNVTRLVSNEGILADASKGTITITNDADTTYFARTNYWVDSGNVHKMTIEQNTEYIIEYTATSSDGAKPSVCAYITGGTATYPESGQQTSYGLGTQYFHIESGNNTKLTLRFDNVQHGSTVTFSDIAVYKAESTDPAYFLDHAQNITNRQYMRYYPNKMGIGDVFEYTPERPGYTFENWWADIDGTVDGNAAFDMTALNDAFIVEQNWHLFSTWTENSYTIKYNANGGTGSAADQTQKYTADVTLSDGSGITRAGYQLLGWSTIPNATVAMYQFNQTTNRLSGDADGTITLYAVWKLTDDALAEDFIVLDFGAPVIYNLFANDTAFMNEASGNTYKLLGFSTDGENYSETLSGTYGDFSISDTNAKYTPDGVISGTENIYYHASLTTSTETLTFKSKVSLAPASNILYEEDEFKVTNATGTAWISDGSATSVTQSATDVYGYDASYANNSKYSGGTAYKVTLSNSNKRAQIMSFEFTGTGFELYGACGPTTGVQVVTVKNSENKVVNANIVDTYYGDKYGELNQVPIVSINDLDYGTYTIQVAATYVTFAGALNNNVSTQAVEGIVDMNAYSSSDSEKLREALAEVGMENVLDAEEVNVIWFDEDSIFNGGYGALNSSTENVLHTAGTTTSLTHVIDSIRVYNPIEDGDAYYTAAEQSAQYFNVMDNLVNGGAVSGKGVVAYVSGNDKESVSLDTYDAKGSKDELYLSNGTGAISFSVANLADGARIMISLRAAKGAPTAKIGGNPINLVSATEMYFDITDYAVNGTIAIQNDTADTLLAVGSIKITGAQTAMLSTFDLETAGFMMMLPIKDDSAPEEDTDADTDVSDPEDNTGADTDTDTDTDPDNGASENWFSRILNWIIEFFRKLIGAIQGLLKF